MNHGPIQVACVSNAGYLPHVATMMESMAASNPPHDLALHLVHDDTVTPDLLQQLHGAAQRLGLTLSTIRPADELLEQLPPSGSYYPSIVWYRILLPELLATQDRVLYLDADTLVLQDLRGIWSTALDGALLAAVAQPEDRQHTVGARARMGLPADAPYLNSGVLLMDLRRMREERFSQRMIDVGRAQAEEWADATHFDLADQDAFNFAGAGRWVELHPKWNCLATMFLSNQIDDYVDDAFRYGEAVGSPAIVHFEGSGFAKPWNYRCIHPLRHLYLTYRKRTPWPLEHLEDSGLVARVLSLLPPRVQIWVIQLKQQILRKGT